MIYVKNIALFLNESINTDLSGQYDNLHQFIYDNNLQQQFVEYYSKFENDLSIDNWDDYTQGEFGFDEEIIGLLLKTNGSYKLFYSEDNDNFVVTKVKNNKINFKITKSNSLDIISVLYESGIHSEYAPRFAILLNNKIIGGSTFEIDDNIYNFDIGILEEFQGYGISSKLINYIVSDAKELSCHGIKANVVNEMLFNYLIKKGFDSIGSRDNKFVYMKI